MEFRRVSEAVIRRMPKYYRQLTVLRDQGMERISSGRLAQMMRLNASQVRQDFNCFGGFGQQGYGYNVNTLLAEIKNILAITHPYNAIIVGAGNIGTALANFDGFEQEGFIIKALFDVKEELLGTEIDGKPVYHIDEMERYVQENNITIGVIAARSHIGKIGCFRHQYRLCGRRFGVRAFGADCRTTVLSRCRRRVGAARKQQKHCRCRKQ